MKSSDIKRKCDQLKKEAKVLGNNVGQLEKIRDNLRDNFYDEAADINKELSNVHSDMNKAINIDGVYNNNLNMIEKYKEVNPDNDRIMIQVISGLENEIQRLNGKKNTAENNYKIEDTNYKNARKEELQNLFHF